MVYLPVCGSRRYLLSLLQSCLLSYRTSDCRNKSARLVIISQVLLVALACLYSLDANKRGVIEVFKPGEGNRFIATDIAACGLDIEKCPVVINFDLPPVNLLLIM